MRMLFNVTMWLFLAGLAVLAPLFIVACIIDLLGAAPPVEMMMAMVCAAVAVFVGLAGMMEIARRRVPS